MDLTHLDQLHCKVFPIFLQLEADHHHHHHKMMLWRTHQSLTMVVRATKVMSTFVDFKLIIIGDTRIRMLNVVYATTCFLRRPHERIIDVRSMAITGVSVWRSSYIMEE